MHSKGALTIISLVPCQNDSFTIYFNYTFYYSNTVLYQESSYSGISILI